MAASWKKVSISSFWRNMSVALTEPLLPARGTDVLCPPLRCPVRLLFDRQRQQGLWDLGRGLVCVWGHLLKCR